MKILNTFLATSAVAMAVMVGGIGLSTASATVATQTITFTSTAPTAATYGSSYTVAATASSGLPVTLSVDPTSTSVCSLSGSKVTFTGVGTCTIDANQPGNATYSAAPQVQQAVTVAQGAQIITITSTAPTAQVAGGPSYTVAASSNFGLPVTFTIAPASSSVCVVSSQTSTPAGTTGTVSGATVDFYGAGTCTIDADQAGNSFARAATRVQQSFAVAAGLQAIAFNSTAPITAQIGGNYRAVAYTGSGTPVTLAVASASKSVCALSGVGAAGPLTIATVKFTGAGTCAIAATQPGNIEYLPAPVVTQSFRVTKAKPSGLTAAAKRKTSKLVVSGKLKLPKGITAAKGYTGKVTVTAVKGGKTVSKASAKLGRNGKYSITLSHTAAAKSLSVTFGGNTVLASSTKKLSLAQ